MKKTVIGIILFLISILNSFSQEINHEHDIKYSFIENKGQWHPDILFQSKFDGGNLWIQQHKFLYHFQDFSLMQQAHTGNKIDENAKMAQSVVHLNFVGSNKVNQIDKVNPTSTYYNYFLGNDSSKWASDVHGYSEASIHNFYDNIDLVIIEHKRELKYEFHVKPQANPNDILMEFFGQENLFLDEKGNLIIDNKLGRIIEKKPYSYQIINGKIKEVKNEFKLDSNRVIFQLGKYDINNELIIDPTLVFATYSGSQTDNFGMTATYAHDGKAYSGGTIFGNNYPTPDDNAFDVSSNFTVENNGQGSGYGITDVFISKYKEDGTDMLWTSFFGGGNNIQGTETVHSLIADKYDNLYLFGATSSVDFPISSNAYQSNHAGGTAGINFTANGVFHKNQGTDIYLSKISSNGQNLLGSTYIGGTGNDGVNYNFNYFNNQSINYGYDSLLYNYGDNSRGEIMLDQFGNVIIASSTWSNNFPTLNSFQNANAGKQDGVIFKLNSNLTSLLFSSYVGGSNNDACYSIKVDSSFNIIFAGGTSSNDLLNTIGAWQATYSGGKADGFVGKILTSSNSLFRISYIGTPNYDQTYFVDIDRNNNIFLVGQSLNGQFPVINSPYSNPNTCQFICKLDENLTTILNSTTFGIGSNKTNISPSAFMVDRCGKIYVSGWGASLFDNIPLSNMPITNNAYQATTTGYDFYLFVLDRKFDNLIYGSYLGGNTSQEHVDGGTSRFDKNGVVYQSVCGGCGGHSDFPTYPNPGAHSNTNDCFNCNNVVFKFDFELELIPEITTSQTSVCTNHTLTLQNTSSYQTLFLWDFGNGTLDSTHNTVTVTYTNPDTYTVTLLVTDSICLLTDSTFITITVLPDIQLDVSPDIYLCSTTTQTLIANSYGTANNFIWSTNSNFTDQLNISTSDSTASVTVSSNGYFYVKASNGFCEKIDSVKTEVISSYLSLNGNDTICKGQNSTLTAINSSSGVTFNYIWSPDSIINTNINLPQIQVNPNTSQYVYVNVTTNGGCVFNDSIYITVGQYPIEDIKAEISDSLIPSGGNVALDVIPSGYLYTWENVSSENTHLQNFEESINKETTFIVHVGDGICMKSDTVIVSIYDYKCEPPFVFVPSGFSPNGDLNNDILFVRGEMIQEMTFRIFDRWGQLIFESHDTHEGWDGTFKGKKLDPDVYDYYLEVICIDEVKNIIKGNVSLLK